MNEVLNNMKTRRSIGIAANLGLVLSNLDEIKSRHDYNKYVFSKSG